MEEHISVWLVINVRRRVVLLYEYVSIIMKMECLSGWISIIFNLISIQTLTRHAHNEATFEQILLWIDLFEIMFLMNMYVESYCLLPRAKSIATHCEKRYFLYSKPGCSDNLDTSQMY